MLGTVKIEGVNKQKIYIIRLGKIRYGINFYGASGISQVIGSIQEE